MNAVPPSFLPSFLPSFPPSGMRKMRGMQRSGRVDKEGSRMERKGRPRREPMEWKWDKCFSPLRRPREGERPLGPRRGRGGRGEALESERARASTSCSSTSSRGSGLRPWPCVRTDGRTRTTDGPFMNRPRIAFHPPPTRLAERLHFAAFSRRNSKSNIGHWPPTPTVVVTRSVTKDSFITL